MSDAFTRWDKITAAAVLGTERAAPGDGLFQAGGELGRVLAASKSSEQEVAVLNCAAILRTYLRAGARCGTTTSPLPAAAERETLPACSRAAENLLGQLFRAERIDVLPETLTLLSAAKQRVPERLIPRLLDRAGQSRDIRDLTRATVGERGKWLAAQNPDWGWLLAAADEIDSIWQTGGLDQRTEALKALRSSDPAKARHLLQTTWAQEPPENRAAFIAALRNGLSDADEEFLEQALDDQRKEVRRIAADLLAHLPNSQLCQRMRQRVTPLLTFQAAQKGKLLKLSRGQKAGIEVTLPESCDKTMQRDGVEPKPPHSKIGEKAWWLQQMLGAVPPAMWSKGWSIEPVELVEIAKESEWRGALLDGWSLAAARHGDASWSAILLEHWIGSMEFAEAIGRVEVIDRMIRAMPKDAADGLLLRLMRNKDLQLYISPVLLMLRATNFGWSGELSHLVIQAMHRIFASWSGHEYEITRAAAECFSLRMAPIVASEAEKGWPTEQWAPMNTKHMNTFLEILRFRHELHKEIKA